MNRTIYVLPMLALLAAAAKPVPQWTQQAIRAAAPSIDRANDEWTRAIVSGDADALSAPYANDGIFIGPDGSEVRGRNAVRAMYAKPRSAKVLKASIKSEGRAAGDPDDVYEWGSATMIIERDGKTRQSSGRYLTVWHRQDKKWVITHNIAF